MTLAAFLDRSRRDKEDWRYTDLQALLKKRVPSVSKTAIPVAASESDSARIVFLNGVFQPQKSHFASVPSCLLMGDLETGYSLTLGEHTCLIAHPIELVFETDDQAPTEIALKFTIDIGKNGRLTLLENFLYSQIPTTIETTINLQANAKFTHGKIVSGGTHLASLSARLARGAYYGHFALLRGASPVRDEMDVSLDGEEAQAVLNGIMLLRDHEHADTLTRIVHNAANGTSRQTFKTVLDDSSHGVFQGKIVVAKGAQKSDGHQLSRALLLSDKAEMDAKPALEIYADDVKCSHGSAIGDLDEDAMFYLRSRGLSEKEARALLIHGFVSEMLDDGQIEAWREIFRREIEAGIQ